MSLVCSGLSHHTASVALRERLSLSPGEVRDLLAAPWFREATDAAGVAEIALLSTCNRTELYATLRTDAFDSAAAANFTALFARAGGVPEGALGSHMYSHAGADAIRHLCRVASGLDSMVIGEAEVLGQVGAALGTAIESETAGPLLDAAFHTALRAGRRARTETSISRRPASIAAEAARLLRDRLRTGAAANVLVIGTGAMGRAIARAFTGDAAITLRITGRTTPRAHEAAKKLGAEHVPWSELARALAAADAVVCAAAVPIPIVTVEMVAKARAASDDPRPRLFVDIGVPRNVEPAVGLIDGVELYDLDQLQLRVEGNVSARTDDVPSVEAIIEEELAFFDSWRRGAELRPVLTALHEKSEAIRLKEMARHLGTLGDADPLLRDALDAFSRALVTKLLHEPSRRLRAQRDPARSRAAAELLQELFDLAP